MYLIDKYVLILAAVGMLIVSNPSFAQEPAADGKTKKMISVTALQPILAPVSDYTGTLSQRTTITGDWDGIRQNWLDSGFAINGSVTQTYRVVAAGGDDTGDTGYNVLFDYGAALDTAKAGFWPGGYIVVNAQAAVESNLPLRDGAVSPSDYNVVFPTLERPTTELMEYYIIQGLSESLGVMLGRVDPVVWDRNRFAFDPRTQFMNGAISQQLLVGGLVSFSTYTASFMWQASEHVTVLGGVFDPVIQAGEFSTPFDDFGVYTVIELDSGSGGTARILAMYDDSDAIAFDNPRLILDEVLGINAKTKSGNWMGGINFEQYLWRPAYAANSHAGTKDLKFSTSSFGFQEPGLGVFGRFGILPDSRNAFGKSVSFGLGGRGIVQGRPFDRLGIAGYWLESSSDLAGLADRLLENEWGAEAFYNYAITPAIQGTLDLQYNDSAINSVDNGFIVGLRLFTQF